jgi:hypothetical protein
MAWIESHQTLKDHPKTAAVCEALGIPRPQLVGHLHLLWWWCIDYAPDGDITKYSNTQLSRASEWPNNPDDFISALVESGFIDRDENSTQIHDWIDFCGPLMERRLQRMAAKRPQMEAERTPTNPTNQPNPTQPTIPREAFEILWQKYPRREGRKEAERHFKASVKTFQDWLDVQNALANYMRKLAREKTDAQFVKHGSTWLNNWRDYVHYNGVELPKLKPLTIPQREPDKPMTEQEQKEGLEFAKQLRETLAGGVKEIPK